MNYLFSFTDFIDVYILAEFEMFCQDLEVTAFTTSANEEEVLFPPNYILVYADTEDESLIETISHKYQQLISESDLIHKPDDFNGGVLQ